MRNQVQTYRGLTLDLLRCGGVMLCTAGELNFHALGFAAVVASTLLRGVKSILQAIRIIMMTAIPCEAPFPTRLFEPSQGRLLTAPEDKLDAMSLLYHMTRSSVRASSAPSLYSRALRPTDGRRELAGAAQTLAPPRARPAACHV